MDLLLPSRLPAGPRGQLDCALPPIEEPATPALPLSHCLEPLVETRDRAVTDRQIAQIDGKRDGLVATASVHELLERLPRAVDVAGELRQVPLAGCVGGGLGL